jgi:hypothetical protein
MALIDMQSGNVKKLKECIYQKGYKKGQTTLSSRLTSKKTIDYAISTKEEHGAVDECHKERSHQSWGYTQDFKEAKRIINAAIKKALEEI